MKHVSYFDDFLKNTVNINQSRLDSLDTSLTSIKKFIRNSDYGTPIRFFSDQGSLAHKTIIKPLPNKPYDADILAIVKENKDWEPRDYLLDLKRVFRKNFTYKDKARLSEVCLTLEYSGDKRIDITPLLEVDSEDDKYHICHNGQNSLIRTEPIQFTDWLIKKNKLSRNNTFRKVTRLLKYLRDYKGTFSCPSVLLTVIIGHRITEDDQDSEAFSDVPTALKTIMNRLNDHLSWCLTRPIVKNPSLDAEDLGKLWTEDQFSNFKSCISRYNTWIDDAYYEEDHNESQKNGGRSSVIHSQRGRIYRVRLPVPL